MLTSSFNLQHSYASLLLTIHEQMLSAEDQCHIFHYFFSCPLLELLLKLPHENIIFPFQQRTKVVALKREQPGAAASALQEAAVELHSLRVQLALLETD